LPTDKVLVLGDGKLGLLIALVLHHCGVDVMVSGRHEEKLAIAARQGVETRRAEELRESRAYEIVIEATGSRAGLETALEQVVPRGTIVLKSAVADWGEVNLSKAVVDEVTIVGSRCGPFAPAVAALASARLNVRPLVSAVYPFDDALSAFERAGQHGVLKVLLDFSTNR
jgi:threonine dehydrogenase-like Zn-dependent dehydrogenase